MRKGQTETGNFRAEVIADNSGKWCGNGLIFDTAENAKDYAADLGCRWFAVRAYRVVQIDSGAVILERQLS